MFCFLPGVDAPHVYVRAWALGSATAATPPAETTQPQIPSSAQVDRSPELTTNSVVAAVVFVGRGRHRFDSLVCEQ